MKTRDGDISFESEAIVSSFRSIGVLLAVGSLYVSAASMAAESSATDSTAADQGALEEIVVTAERRATGLERTPVAVSVLSGDALDKQEITTETDLRTTAPGLSVRSTANSNQLNYVIRGQSLDAFSNNRPGVLPYVDEVQVGGAGTASAFYDLASIQVLKGPQGTLFGRNATGGAVLFTTQQPTNDLSGYITVRGGNYDLRYYEGALNVPIVDDKVLLRVAGFSEAREGYQYNLYTDSRVGDIDRYGFRASLTVNFTEAIKNVLVADYSRYDGAGTSAVLWNTNSKIGAIPATGFYAGGAVTDAYFTGAALAAGAPPGTSLAGAWAAYVATHPTTNPNGLASVLANQRANGPFTVDFDGPDSNAARNLIFSNITTWDIAENTQIKNIAGHTQLDSNTDFDADGTPYDIDDNFNVNNTRQTSDELQLLGKTLAEKLSYVGGIYYSNESTEIHLASALLGLEPYIPPTPQHNDYIGTNKTLAEYTQGTYDLAELTGVQGLGFTLGVRHTSEKIGSLLLPTASGYAQVLANPATEAVDQSKTFNNISWTIGVQDQLNPDVLLYAVSRRSYKNGGYNGTLVPVIGPGDVGGNGYLTETDTDGELGVKFQGSIATMPTRMNAALYNQWISNDQRVAYTTDSFGSPAPISVNVPRAKVSGVELDGQISPLSWLSVGASYDYTDGRFTSNLVSILGRTPIVFGTYPDTPKSMATLYSDVTIPIRDGLAVVLHGDIYNQTAIAYSSTANINTGAILPGFAVTDFRVSLDSKQGWTVSALVKNAFNRVYYAGGIATAELFQFNSAIPGDPRTASLELHYKF
jgi:iron complex outermembrane receptor protein